MKKKAWSVTRSIIAMYAALIILPATLLFVVEASINDYYRGRPNFFSELLNPPKPFTQTVRFAEPIERAFNIALVDNPERAISKEYLDSLSYRFPENLSLILRIDGEIVYKSQYAKIGSVDLPPFLSKEKEPEPFLDPPDRIQVIRQYDFKTVDNKNASFFVLHNEEIKKGNMPPFSRQVIIMLITLITLINGITGLYFISRLLSPLKKLENAAKTMGSRNFSVPIIPDYRVKELEPVFNSFETMRLEVKDLLKAKDMAEKNRVELIANLSHDLKTPLSAIKGYSEGLQEGIANTKEKSDRYLKTIYEKSCVLETMIERIFLLSTLEAGSENMNFMRVSLSNFLSDSTQDLNSIYGEKRLHIDFTDTSTEIFAAIDPLQMRRVMENLVENAVRHGEREIMHIDITLNTITKGSDTYAQIEVKDSGIGICKEYEEKIFERFFTLDEARSKKGSGLGLAICKTIMAFHQGTINYKRTADAGACFVLELPCEGVNHV